MISDSPKATLAPLIEVLKHVELHGTYRVHLRPYIFPSSDETHKILSDRSND